MTVTGSREALKGNTRALRHGHTRGRKHSPTYESWRAMLARVRYLERDTEQKHAGRGITVCERWQTFDNFLADMGERPAGSTIDRIDNDGNYRPSNCKWSTPTEQARNRRNAKLTFETAVEVAGRMLAGESSKSVAAVYGLSESLPREILKGRTWKDALARAKELANVH